VDRWTTELNYTVSSAIVYQVFFIHRGDIIQYFTDGNPVIVPSGTVTFFETDDIKPEKESQGDTGQHHNCELQPNTISDDMLLYLPSGVRTVSRAGTAIRASIVAMNRMV
jgi:hypothetical protein